MRRRYCSFNSRYAISYSPVVRLNKSLSRVLKLNRYLLTLGPGSALRNNRSTSALFLASVVFLSTASTLQNLSPTMAASCMRSPEPLHDQRTAHGYAEDRPVRKAAVLPSSSPPRPISLLVVLGSSACTRNGFVQAELPAIVHPVPPPLRTEHEDIVDLVMINDGVDQVSKVRHLFTPPFSMFTGRYTVSSP